MLQIDGLKPGAGSAKGKTLTKLLKATKRSHDEEPITSSASVSNVKKAKSTTSQSTNSTGNLAISYITFYSIIYNFLIFSLYSWRLSGSQLHEWFEIRDGRTCPAQRWWWADPIATQARGRWSKEGQEQRRLGFATEAREWWLKDERIMFSSFLFFSSYSHSLFQFLFPKTFFTILFQIRKNSEWILFPPGLFKKKFTKKKLSEWFFFVLQMLLFLLHIFMKRNKLEVVK